MKSTTAAVRHIYLDHSVITHTADWANIRRVFENPGNRLVLSIWNLLEIAGATDLEQRTRRIALLEACKPLWLCDHSHVRKQEVLRYLCTERFKTEPPDINPFTTSLSVAQSIYAGPEVKIGLTMTELVDGLGRFNIDDLKHKSTQVLMLLQSVPRNEWRTRQPDMFRAVVRSFVPVRHSSGAPLTTVEIDDIVNFCWRTRKKLFRACPAMAVDQALCEARTSDPKRKPDGSDAADLAHAVMALAYCDQFVTRDLFLLNCADQCVRRLPAHNLAGVVCDISALT